MFARANLVGISAGIFFYLERRLAYFPYLLQHLVSAGTPPEHKARLRARLKSMRECCAGSLCARLRKVFPTTRCMETPAFERAVRMFEACLKLSTAPVENEHKVVKQDAHSTTSASNVAPVCWRMVVKHLQAAHLQRGGVDVAIFPGRPGKLGTGPVLSLPPAPPAASQELAAIANGQVQGGLEGHPVVAGINIDDLGGGNPMVCFISFRLQTFAKSHPGSTRARVREVQAEVARKYDECQDTRSRRARDTNALHTRVSV